MMKILNYLSNERIVAKEWDVNRFYLMISFLQIELDSFLESCHLSLIFFFLLFELLWFKGFLIANEPDLKRCKVLAGNMKLFSSPCIMVTNFRGERCLNY